MDILNQLLQGFLTAGTPVNLLWALLGCTIGTAVGVLPASPRPPRLRCCCRSRSSRPTASMIFSLASTTAHVRAYRRRRSCSTSAVSVLHGRPMGAITRQMVSRSVVVEPPYIAPVVDASEKDHRGGRVDLSVMRSSIATRWPGRFGQHADRVPMVQPSSAHSIDRRAGGEGSPAAAGSGCHASSVRASRWR